MEKFEETKIVNIEDLEFKSDRHIRNLVKRALVLA